MNAIGRSARGAIILVVALLIGTWIISRTTNSPVSAESNAGGDTPSESSTIASSTTTTPALPPRDRKTVRVLMVNGTKTDGIAKRARNCVIGTFDALPPTNSSTKPADSALYAQPGFEAEGREVAAALAIQLDILPFPAAPNVKAMPTPEPNIMLIIGDQIAPGIRNLPCAVSVVPNN